MNEGYRQILGVGENPTPAELAQAYRRRAFETHPDRGGSLREFLSVQKAYLGLGGGRPEAPAPAAIVRLEPDVADFGSLPAGGVARRAVLVSCHGGPGGALAVEPLRGAWWTVVDVRPAGPAGDLAVLVLAVRPTSPGNHEDALVVRVGTAAAHLPLVVRARAGA